MMMTSSALTLYRRGLFTFLFFHVAIIRKIYLFSFLTEYLSFLSTPTASFSLSTSPSTSLCISPLVPRCSPQTTAPPHTDTSSDSIYFARLPQSTAFHYKMLLRLIHSSTQFTALPEYLFLHLSVRVLVRYRNMSTDPNAFLYILFLPYFYIRCFTSKSSFHLPKYIFFGPPSDCFTQIYYEFNKL